MSNTNVNTPHSRQAQVSAEILSVIRDRWSPYAFADRPVPHNILNQCFLAASWAASSYNEQPWYFLVAQRTQAAEFDRMLGCLLEANQVWARFASTLILTVSQEAFSRNGSPNRVHQYDLGQSMAHFALQATAHGVAVHQMAGIQISKIKAEYQIPDGFTPQTAVAVGYAVEKPLAGQEGFADRDQAPRKRKSLDQFVFYSQWGKP
jgi:nitroreductase